MKAAYQTAIEGGQRIRCDLCPHHCVMKEGETGICRVRGVRGGELQALSYGQVSSAAVDPIEKKPLYHFHPGRSIFSVGGWGCNFRCEFCQNWTISQQADLDGRAYTPERVVAEARASGSVGIAYTYNEPLVGFEFVRDCARLAREGGLPNVLVTNGYVCREPAADLLPLVDALNIDIKGMDEDFYHRLCHGRLNPVLDFCRQSRAAGCHVEITNLMIPNLNDGESQVRALARWIRHELGAATPLHLSAYHPEYRLDAPPTPVATLRRAYAICREDLQYVYMGNVRGAEGQDTHCPGCEALLISRAGYATAIRGLKDGRCAACGRKADIVGGVYSSSAPAGGF